jgi:hypothetical protein
MDENANLPMEQIKSALECLKSLDKKRQVFGSTIHQYESHTLSNIELELWEEALGVCLPEEYRRFLHEIGYGAGPYYGLLKPAEILNEMDELNGDTSFSPSKPFPFSLEQAEDCFKTMGEGRRAVYWTAFPTDGCIPICHEGCLFYTFLVTAGDLAGSLWSHNLDPWDFGDEIYDIWNLVTKPLGLSRNKGDQDRQVWEPALSPFPTFLEWYNSWLQQSTSDCQTLKPGNIELIKRIFPKFS